MTPIRLDQYRTRLLQMQATLQDGNTQATESASTVELDQAKVGRLSRMDALQMQAMARDSLNRRQIQLRRIDAALTRIEQNRYGICPSCDEDIGPGRLNADPATPLCIDCASEAGQ